jgi:hypothetical protein
VRRLRLLPVLPLLVGGLSTAGAVTAVGPSAVGCASAASAHHAALVIEHGSGATLKFCIGFNTEQVSGQYLLDASGVEKAEQDYGSTGQAVCQLDHEPEPYPAGCWTPSSPYWALYVSRGGGGWSASSLGVSSQTFRDGDAEGFRYEGQSAYLTPASASGICPPPSPPPTATAAPRSTIRATTTPTGQHASPSPTSPGRTPTAAAATPAIGAPPNSSSTPDVVVVAGPSSAPPPPSFRPGVGALAALALAAVLVALLILRGVRQRGLSRAESSER